jgi:hypothetical protein
MTAVPKAGTEGFGGFRPLCILNRSFAVLSSERMSPSSIAERLLTATSDRSCRPTAVLQPGAAYFSIAARLCENALIA